MALASAFELDYHLLLAFELGVIHRATFLELETEVKGVKKMVSALIDRVRTSEGPRPLRKDGQTKQQAEPTTENQ